jgi:hypothetical protein
MERSRIAGAIDDAQVVTLAGNVHPLAREEFDRGVVSAETRLGRMVLVLEPSAAQQAELDALVAAQHDPHSPLYRQWLTPAQYGERFGASAEDGARVAAWLEGHGLTVEEIPASNRLIVFSGTAGQVAETFHTDIHCYLVAGVEHIANSEDPQIPAALTGVVGGVVSLHNFRRRSQIKTRVALAADALLDEGTFIDAQPLYTSGGTHYLFPADWAAIYDLNSLYDAGTAGTGVSIAIAGRSNIDLSDVAAFRSTAGLAANNPTVILVWADPGLVAGDQDEATLDVEWSGAVARAAAVELVAGKSTATTDGVDLAAQYIVNHALAQVVSTSYGSCEQEMGTAELEFYNSLWEQAASQGMSAFVASGDAGAAGCYEGVSASGSGTAVNGLCSSPYATCVGGTEFNEGSNPAQYWAATNPANYGTALGYIPEEVWNESALNGGTGLWASGGGASVVYAQPPWQKAVIGTSAANGMRAVPDVAVTAAAHDGYVIYENGSYYVVSGTSAASPAFAGVMALVVERQGGSGVGNANAGLYSQLSAAHNPFHATPSGNNSVPGVTGFTASGAEYNLATGLGSVDGALLVNEWSAGSATGTDFALTASAAGATVVAGQSATFTVSVTESGAAKDAVALTAKGPSGVTVAVQPGSIAPGTAATVTIAVGSAAAAGTGSVTITGSDLSGTQTLTYALTVTPAPALTLTAASSSVVVAEGGSGTVSLTAATSGSFTGAISFSVSGMPAGVTAAWSANPLVAASSVSANPVTLTLTASATAAVGVTSIVATAAGDGLVSSQSIRLQVQRAAPITLAVLPVELAAGAVGTPYPQTTITAGGGVAPYTYVVSSGALPAGLTLSTAGVLTGTPAAAGSFPFTITATDSSPGAGANTGRQSYTVVISQAAVTDFTIEVASGASSSATVLPGGNVGESFTVSPANGAGVFSDAIALSASGLPAGATAVFSPASVPAGSGTTTVTLAIQAPQSSADSVWAGGGVAGSLAPFSLALLLLPLAGRLRRGGKRIGRLISLLLAIAGMAAIVGLNGCKAVSGSPGQTSQTYTVTVTGTSGALSHSTTFTLTVE